MDTLKITITGHVNTGKSALARLIVRSLKSNGITCKLSIEEKEEGFPEDYLDLIVEDVLTRKVNVIVDTAIANKNSVIE